MDNDIILLLYRIKVNIRNVEDGDQSVLDDITEDYLALMDLIKLFLISERETYYGYFLMNMTFQVDYKKESVAGIALNQYPPVFVANPLLYAKFSLKEMIFIACHEIEHVILNHPAAMICSNPTKNPDIYKRFNYAADASVNDRLIADIKRYKLRYMSFPKGGVDSAAFAEVFNLKKVRANENYQYYFNLINDKNPDEDSMSSAMQQAAEQEDSQQESDSNESASGENMQSEGEPGEGTPGEGTPGDDASTSDNGGIVTAKNCKNPSTHDWGSAGDADSMQEMTKEFVNDVVDMMGAEGRGTMPASFMSQVKLLNEKPAIRWEQVLKKYVGTITAGYRKTRIRLNRRQPERFDLSGKMEEKTLKIVVAIDTSGSMGDHMISKVFDEIFAILSKKKYEMTVIECDAAIQRVYKVKQRKDVQTSVRGRGGTSFVPVIEYINNNKYYRDALLIYFTDGYGDRSIPKPLTYRNMWVVLGREENLSLQEPYGIVIKM